MVKFCCAVSQVLFYSLELYVLHITSKTLIVFPLFSPSQFLLLQKKLHFCFKIRCKLMSRQIYIFRIHFIANSTKSTWMVAKNSSLSKCHNCNLPASTYILMNSWKFIALVSDMSRRETTYKGLWSSVEFNYSCTYCFAWDCMMARVLDIFLHNKTLCRMHFSIWQTASLNANALGNMSELTLNLLVITTLAQFSGVLFAFVNLLSGIKSLWLNWCK